MVSIKGKLPVNLDVNSVTIKNIFSKGIIGSLEQFNNVYMRTTEKERTLSEENKKNVTMLISEPEIRHYKNVIVSPMGALYRQNFYPIYEGFNQYEPELYFPPPVGVKKHLHIPENFSQKISHHIKVAKSKSFHTKKISSKKAPILFFDYYFSNFTHFLVEAFPRLYMMRDYLNDHPIIIPPIAQSGYDYYQYIAPCLESLGIKKSDCIMLENDVNYKFKELILPAQVKFHPEHVIPAVEHLKFFYKKDLTKVESTVVDRKIYIAREKSQFRNILNAKDLESCLCSDYDFQKVNMEDIGFREKIQMMSEVSVLVSPYGSGSVGNSVLMPRSANYLAFLIEDTPILFDVFISSLFDKTIYYQISKPENVDDMWYRGNLEVDISELRKNLDAILAKGVCLSDSL